MQHMGILEWYRDLAEIFGNDRNVVADLPIDEDCLYLNIWTPMLDEDANLPVMVYIHGGSCLLYTSPSPRDKRQSRMPSSA